MRMQSMLAFDKSMAREIFIRTNMDYCLADETSKGVYDKSSIVP
jgi:hypothetical protein